MMNLILMTGRKYATVIWMVMGLSLASYPVLGDQYSWDFSQTPENTLPTNCQSIVGGQGNPGNWKVVTVYYPVPLEPVTSRGASSGPKSVVQQSAIEPLDEHFPMLQLGTNIYKDFKFTTHFKLVEGALEQMAGVAFRMHDTSNYYYVRASGLGKNFTFFKVANGERSEPITTNLSILKGEWHELTIECEGASLKFFMDGKQTLPTITNTYFPMGKIALWTKSDAVSQFADCHITYKPSVAFVDTLVRDAMKQFRSMTGVQVLTVDATTRKSKIIASSDPAEKGQAGETTDYNCFDDGKSYFRKEGKTEYVTLPLRDRNGEPLGVVRCILKRQTLLQERENALLRGKEIVGWMQDRVSAVDSLY